MITTAAEFDLALRPDAVATARFAYSDRYLTLGQAGRVERDETVSGFITQE
jgi:hypothetical protein